MAFLGPVPEQDRVYVHCPYCGGLTVCGRFVNRWDPDIKRRCGPCGAEIALPQEPAILEPGSHIEAEVPEHIVAEPLPAWENRDRMMEMALEQAPLEYSSMLGMWEYVKAYHAMVARGGGEWRLLRLLVESQRAAVALLAAIQRAVHAHHRAMEGLGDGR